MDFPQAFELQESSAPSLTVSKPSDHHLNPVFLSLLPSLPLLSHCKYMYMLVSDEDQINTVQLL